MASSLVNEAHDKGLNAVIVPWGNAHDLQLKPEVVQAVREGKFKIYRVKTVQQGIELLTGVPYQVIKKRVEQRLGRASPERRAAGGLRRLDAVSLNSKKRPERGNPLGPFA